MEPIRPDQDEVAARKTGSEPRGKSASPVNRAAVSGPAAHSAGRRAGFAGGAVPLVLVLVLALGGGVLLFRQHQSIEQLQASLADAEDWVSRTKLSMARFEGRLSEADRELLESGSEITEKLEFLDSEMRKLWGVSYDTNRKGIQANKETTEFLTEKADYLDQQRAEQNQLLEQQGEDLAAVSAAVESLQQSVSSVVSRQDEVLSAVADTTRRYGTLAETQKQLKNQLTTSSQRVSLGLDELRARIGSIERQLAESDSQAAVNRVQAELAELEEVVAAIDASRSQLTSRLLRLEDRLKESLQGGAAP